MNLRTNFTLTQLEYVLAVHRLGHFAKAAAACQVTQPTLSMQIQKLEENLGVMIFDRSKKPILLTDVGRQLIEQMQSIVSESKKIESILETSKSGNIQGELLLGVIPTIAPYILPRLMPVLSTKFSGLKLTIREMQTHRIVEALQNDEIDVGLLATPIKEPRIIEFALYYEPFFVLCNKKHEFSKLNKINYSALKADDIWLLEEGHCLRHQILDVCSLKKGKHLNKQFTFESGSIETLKSIVDSVGGYTLIPWLAKDEIGKSTELLEFERPIPSREIGLVYRREHYKTELIEKLGEAIIESIPEVLRKMRKKDLDVIPIE